MDHAQGAVAILDRVGQHPDGGEIVDLVEVLPQGELVGDAVDVLGPARGIRLDADRRQLALQDVFDVIDVGLALLSFSGDSLDDLLVLIGVELGERQVFQLPLDVPHAEPVRERRVDVEGLLGHGSAAVLG